MRKSRRFVVALAVSALVAAGGGAAALVSQANVQTTCDSSDNAGLITCQIDTQEILKPAAITLVVTLKSGDGQNDQYIRVTWQGNCAQGGIEKPVGQPAHPPTRAPISKATAVSINVPLPYTNPDNCFVSAVAELTASLGGGIYTTNTTGSFQLEMEYTPAVSASATPSPSASPPVNVPLIRGYGGKCLDDKGNRPANRTEVIIWTCNSADPSQGWKFSNGELVHNGKCASDQGNGGSGTKVIVWTCTHAPDETWSHTSGDGEFVLGSTSHGRLCLTDPGYSRTNRTQLIVSACHNTSNQHWT